MRDSLVQKIAALKNLLSSQNKITRNASKVAHKTLSRFLEKEQAFFDEQMRAAHDWELKGFSPEEKEFIQAQILWENQTAINAMLANIPNRNHPPLEAPLSPVDSIDPIGEVEGFRHHAIQKILDSIEKIQSAVINQRSAHQKLVVKEPLLKLRRRIYLITRASTEEEIGTHLYEAFQTDLSFIENGVREHPAEWKGWDRKTAEVLEQAQLDLKVLAAQAQAEDRATLEIAEKFNALIFQKIAEQSEKIIIEFATRKIKKNNVTEKDIAQKTLTDLNSLAHIAKNIREKRTALTQNDISSEEKITSFYTFLLAQKKAIMENCVNTFRASENTEANDRKSLLGIGNNEEAVKEEEKYRKTFEKKPGLRNFINYNSRLRNLSRQNKLVDQIEMQVSKEIKTFGPNSLLEKKLAERHHALFAIDQRCVAYIQRKTKSHWYKNIEFTYTKSQFGNGATPVQERLRNAYEQFLQQKRTMLEETERQAVGRSHLFNSETLKMIDAILNYIEATLGNELEFSNEKNQVKELQTRVEKKYPFWCLGYKKPWFKAERNQNEIEPVPVDGGSAPELK